MADSDALTTELDSAESCIAEQRAELARLRAQLAKADARLALADKLAEACDKYLSHGRRYLPSRQCDAPPGVGNALRDALDAYRALGAEIEKRLAAPAKGERG